MGAAHKHNGNAHRNEVRSQDGTRRGPTLHDHAVTLLRVQVAALRKRMHAYFRDSTAANLHAVRVALRRLRTLVLAFEDAVPLPREADDKALRGLGRTLGVRRDADVAREALASLAEGPLPPEERAALQTRLDAAQAASAPESMNDAKIETMTRSQSAELESHMHAVLVALDAALGTEPSTALGKLPFAVALPALVGRFVDEFFLHRAWTIEDPESDPHALHALRKRAKRLRYFLEFHDGDLPKGAHGHAVVKKLKEMQDVLGSLQDTEVVEGRVEDFEKCDGDSAQQLRFPTLRRRLVKRRAKQTEKWHEARAVFLANPLHDRIRGLCLTQP